MDSPEITIRQATASDLDDVVPLFDAYRRFYRLAGDLEKARHFLQERFVRQESVIFLASANGATHGFTQLYPAFSSGAMARIFILNDLYVAPEGRRQGIGAALLQAAATYGRAMGAVRLTLSTELTNATAQSLYESQGWKRDLVFCVYQFPL